MVQLTLHSLHQKQPKLNRQLRLFIQTEDLVCNCRKAYVIIA